MDGNNERSRQISSHEAALGPPKADFSAPPPYELTNSNINNNHNNKNNNNSMNDTMDTMPITLSAVTDQQNQSLLHAQHFGKLPTYEEVQMEKSLNGEFLPAYMNAHGLQSQNMPPPPNPLLANITGDVGNNNQNGQRALTFIAIDASGADNLANPENSLLGTDVLFITAFMIALLFNWVGFLILTCFCHTIASRYGALSGFGLSLAKWTLIFKHSTQLVSHENSWLWWLIIAFGFLICIRAFIQYISIKRTWRLLSTSAQERLLFFY